MGPKEAPPFDDGDNDMEMGPQSTASPSEPGPLPVVESEDGLPDFDATNTTEDASEMAKKKKKTAKKSKTKAAPKAKAKKPTKLEASGSRRKPGEKKADAAKAYPPMATDPAGTHNYPAKRAKAGEGKTRFIGVLIHTSEETLKRIDRKVAELQKKSPDSRISRSSFVRGLIDKATAV